MNPPGPGVLWYKTGVTLESQLTSEEVRERLAKALPRFDVRTGRPVRGFSLFRKTCSGKLRAESFSLSGPDSAESRLQEHFKNPALQAVHRLDRDTSGCFLIAKSAAACTAMVKVFQERAVAKTYLAIVRGRVPPTLRMIRTPIEGQEAITHIRLMRAVREASLLQIELETGRTHQIRRHLAGTGHPLVGDKQYETRAVENETIRRVRRQMLHASKLSFKHPKTGELIEAAAALPIDFRTTKRALKIG